PRRRNQTPPRRSARMHCADARNTAAGAARPRPASSPAPARAHAARPAARSPARASRPGPPYAVQPRLLLARQAGGPVVVLEFAEACLVHQRAPGGQVVIRAVAPAVP